MKLRIQEETRVVNALRDLAEGHAAIVIQGPDLRVLIVDVPREALLRVRDIVIDRGAEPIEVKTEQ